MSVKVLIADDEDIIRCGVAKYIKLHTDRFDKIYEAENGQQAIDILLKYHPDIMILDIQMPLKTGLDVMKEDVYKRQAMYPKYVSRAEVSQEFMDHEKEILLAQAKKENPEKPDNIIEKMIIGRLNKELKEICLLDQVYVQDSDLTVQKYVDKVAKENNAKVTVKKFIRFETGEGLEKKVDDFAAEVAAQAGL